MKKFSWAVVGFGFNRQGGSHLLQIEEAGDKLSEAAVLLKQARMQPEVSEEEVDQILKEIAISLDRVRKIRNGLKGIR